MIEQQSGQLTTVTTICNYSKYQTSEAASDTADEATSGAADEAAGGAQDKKVNKGKKEKNNTGGSALDFSELPDGFTESVVRDFVEHRNKIKKPLTQRALTLCLNCAATAHKFGLTPDQVLEETVAQGWQKPNPEWVAKKINNTPQRDNVTPIRKDGAVRDESGQIKGWWMFGGTEFVPNPQYRRQA